MSAKYRIGVDVGGTNTDAVILKCAEDTVSNAILAWHKSPTTPDVTDGIASALDVVLKKSQINKLDIVYLSIGTTHFLNAVIEADARRLSKVAVLRLSGPYTARCPSFIDFPPRLRAIIEGHVAIVDGGLEIDGKEIVPINDAQIREQCAIIRSKGLKNVVIVGVFSPLASAGTQEEHVKRIIEETLGEGTSIVCSKDVGHIGLLERENASILNASILSFARRTLVAYRMVLKRLELSCPLFLTQLDGTLVPSSVAATMPIRTFSNGPTNSMRGAAFLAGLDKKYKAGDRKSKIVIDVGGTTTDVGVLLPSGFPRKAAAFTYVGGVRTSFSMPDIHCIGLGGGSRVRFSSSGSASVGPDSVGHAILSHALVFGGETLTATDLAISSFLTATPSPSTLSSIGDSTRTDGVLSLSQIISGTERIRKMLENAIDKVKTEPGDIEVLLVGGGAVIVPPVLSGVSNIVRPPFFDVANAVGAAIARVAGGVDRIEIPGGKNGSIEDVVERCKVEAVRDAVAAGADEASVEVAEVAVIQLPYVANHASRVIIRAVGDLNLDSIAQQLEKGNDMELSFSDDEKQDEARHTVGNTQDGEPDSADIDPSSYRPDVSCDGVWSLSETDIEWLAEGCAVLGCGGGGATYAAFLMAREALRKGRHIHVVSADYLIDHEDSRKGERKAKEGWVMPCGFMGSPSVSSERIPSGHEIPTACLSSMRFLGIDKSQISAVISDEIGGKNGLEPMLLASQDGFEFPVVDGDLMGRAYPRLEQILPCIFKENGLYPVSAADGVGNCMIVPTARNSPIVEDMLRAACTVLGSSVALSISPLRSQELKHHAILNTTSQAWRIGRAIAVCRKLNNLRGVPDTIVDLQDGKCLFVGKIIEVKREVKGGFTHGQITIAPLLQEEQETQIVTSSDTKLIIPFQNENICAELFEGDGSHKIICSVPDLIAVLDSQSGASIGTQDYRYGLRVTVLGLSCDPRWTTPKGLEIGGPQAFGLTNDYVPIGVYTDPRSVIKEFQKNVDS